MYTDQDTRQVHCTGKCRCNKAYGEGESGTVEKLAWAMGESCHPCTLVSSMAQASFSTSGLTFSLLLMVLLSVHIARHTILPLVRN